MKTKTKIKKYVRKNSGKLIIIGTLTLVGVVANINLLLIKPSISIAEVNYPKKEIEQIKEDKEFKVVSETIREVTMYNAGDPNQCDDTPCISANGENICEALVLGYKRCASNAYPMGTDLRLISPVTGWQYVCKVTDRMNKRYSNRVDIALPLDEYERAIKFGVQNLIVQEVITK